MAGFFEKISNGLGSTREKFHEQVNILLDKGPDLDDEFWDGLEEALISADVGAPATLEIVDNLKDEARRKALPDAKAVLELLTKRISEQFAKDKKNILQGEKAVLLFVGINGTGKTTTVGKIAKEATDLGVNVILGSADTFRAAAIEQLEVWSKRANVEMVTRERGSDPASVCYATIERAEQIDSDLVLIDTAGRLHTSKDLMAELEKVCNVTRKRSKVPVYVVLVIDATTGQNGLTQAKEFNKSLDLDALIVTKLDGTAKGGIALAISKELDLPILKIGVGEKIEDLRNFNPDDFARAFIGDFSKDKNIDVKIENQQDIKTIEEKVYNDKFSSKSKNSVNDLNSDAEFIDTIHDEENIAASDTVETVDDDLEDDNFSSSNLKEEQLETIYQNNYNTQITNFDDKINDSFNEDYKQISKSIDKKENDKEDFSFDDNKDDAVFDYSDYGNDDKINESKGINNIAAEDDLDRNNNDNNIENNSKKGKFKGLFRKLFVD